MGFWSRLFGGESEENVDIARPEYYEDPDYRETQDFLKTFGMDILKGDIPEYYAPIGETGGESFEKMLGLTTRDITQSATEALAKGGRARGGQLAATIAPAVADTSIKARFQDYLRSLEGKGFLLQTGTGITERVRAAGQTEGQLRNAFNWQDYAAQVGERAWQVGQEEKRDAALGETIGTIASIGLGAATGGMSFGWQGALAGATDALTGGGTSFLSTLGKIKTPEVIDQSEILGESTRKWSK